MTRCIALLRGINVGRAKAVPMEALRAVVESLGHTDVVTVLRSGNVVFDSAGSEEVPPGSIDRRDLARGIEQAVTAATGVSVDVLVFDATMFRAIAEANPLTPRASDLSRLIVTFLSDTAPESVAEPDAAELAPEELAVGPRAVYQWLPDGVLQTKVGREFWTQFDGVVTARNARTVARLVALSG